jgi:probable LLM family oxidoreductase
MTTPVEFGLDTFGDVTVDAGGRPHTAAQVIRDVVEQGVLADDVGVDAFGIGEHHREDFAVSAPDVVLTAIAARTTRIRLGSAVTVLSSDDPIRVFQRFSTLDAISGGRAEITVGRGSFVESFPLFGYGLEDYEVLFSEKLDLFAELLRERPVTWSGTVRPPLAGARVFPPTESGGLRTWVGVGGSTASVIRAATYGLPLMIAIIGGSADRFVPLADLYRAALEQQGLAPLPIGVHSPGHVAATDEQAVEEFWPGYLSGMTRIGAERGWPPPTRLRFDDEVAAGSLYVGSPETVARRIAATVATLGLRRFDLKYATGPMPHAQLMSSIELYGSRVVPLVRDLLA